ncbi:MAG: adenosylhomocysteinase [Omnitrophica bacterium GWA2_41_15]|nr:MAG: adenosylhomocysteinase [Omnitrophica bacterium GWA2_41_15]HAZ09677.1 adenosylhomocysteinase [Candidatus Omnitrophota bacterium]
MKYDITNIKLAPTGKLRIEWADENMPVLKLIRERFSKEKPLKGVRVSSCLHVTTETAVLMNTLKSGGAEVNLCASNPLSTQDDVAASLVKDSNIPVFAIRGEDNKSYYSHIESSLGLKPNVTMDDGADLVSTIHKSRLDLVPNILGSTEETTTGIIRLRSLEQNKKLLFPVIAVNDADTKHLFDNRYGTGQSTVDGVIRATNILIAGKIVVVLGYGWCGRGFAMRARGMGANVIITEVDSTKALEAVMDGYSVMPMKEAAKKGDLFVSLTGNTTVIAGEHFKVMKDGAIVANSGHFNVEIEIPALEKMSSKKRVIRNGVEEYLLKDGRRINLLGEGRLVNLACAEGHPAIVMDMSFANQALAAEYLVKSHKKLDKKVYRMPEAIDKEIARLKLKSMGIQIDILTAFQKKYLSSWELGT